MSDADISARWEALVCRMRSTLEPSFASLMGCTICDAHEDRRRALSCIGAAANGS